ncbi:MAG TPA: hypothetical protein VLQ93_02540, partial [Myxococcaceae bacterium]|nr:hypothetical protein [Myxococcaceae bacterium]
GGANVRLDPEDPELQNATSETLERALVKNEGRPVTASYITDDAGVLWPADFHTWNLVTTYYNFERAWDYFREDAAVPVADLSPTTVYYFPEFVLKEASEEPQRDNALFFSPVKAFLVLPFEEIQSAPLAINASVITHEYAHLVFNRKVYGGQALPTVLAKWPAETPSPGLNVLKSLDEGLADFHAYVASCQTAFGCNTQVLATSFEGKMVEERDLSKNWCMDKDLRQALLTLNFSQFSGREYKVGTILASALYKASTLSPAHRQQLARAVVAAYDDLADLTGTALHDQQQFTLAKAAKSIVQQVTDPDLKRAVCTKLVTHLQIPLDELVSNDGGCPASTTTDSSCSDINNNLP